MELTAQHLTIGYTTALHPPIDLTVRTGEIVGLTGPSGAGKTTLLRTLAGLTPPLDGTVTATGQIGMLAQHPRQVTNPRWRLHRVIAEPAAIHGRTASATGLADLARKAGLDPQLLQRFPSQVSDGQLQRACLARLLAHNPQWVLCDEPTAMLDPIASGTITTALTDLAAAGSGILIASHNHQQLHALADRVIDIAELGADLTR